MVLVWFKCNSGFFQLNCLGLYFLKSSMLYVKSTISFFNLSSDIEPIPSVSVAVKSPPDAIWKRAVSELPVRLVNI